MFECDVQMGRRASHQHLAFLVDDRADLDAGIV
jgi:hypothetical protein